MAFLGDFGKFFGLPDSKTVLGDAGAATATFFGFDPVSGRALGRAAARATDNLADKGTANQPEGQSTVPTPTNRRKSDSGVQETQGSGTNTIDLTTNRGMRTDQSLSLLQPLLQGAGRFLSSRGGQIATGVGIGGATSMLGRNGQDRPILTQSRRNKSKVRQLVNFMGIEGTADFLSQSIGQNVSPNDVVALLLRTFRNDGAFITKAQVRNLRRTTNRFKSLEKQVKEATSMTRTTRRAPVRRASSTTLIKN